MRKIETADMGQEIEDAAERLFNQTQQATMMETLGAARGRKPQALVCAITAAAGALQLAALILSNIDSSGVTPENAENQMSALTNEDAMVTAALLAARCVRFNSAGPKLDYSADRILRAVKAASLVVGHDVDDIMDPGMMAAARHVYDASDDRFFGGLNPSERRVLN